jgi:hypothetical protein
MLLSNGKAQTVIIDDIMDAVEAVDAIVRAGTSGSSAVTADAATLAITFINAQPDALYQVVLDLTWHTTWVASKSTTGTTITFGVPCPTVGGTAYWRVER